MVLRTRHNPIENTNEEERQALVSCLTETRTRIRQAYGSFNNAQDNDLIESYVYEIKALYARYNYLLRRVKELEGAP